MGRLFITNDKNIRSVNSVINEETGFLEKGTINEEFFTIDVYKKRNIKHENMYMDDDNRFIFGTGTYIYKNKLGVEALKAILHDFYLGIPFIQNNVIGHFAIGIQIDKTLFLFTDKYNIYEVFYSNSNSKGKWAISNSFYNLVKSSGENTLLREKFEEEIFQIGTMGEETFIKNINKLMGYQYIQITGDSVTIKRNKYEREKLTFSSFEDCVEKYHSKVKNVFGQINNAFNKNIVLDMTGGFDSRVIFSSFNAVGSKVNLAYGIGNSNITNTKNEDFEIVKEFSRKYERPLHIMNWNHNYEFDKTYLLGKLKEYGIHYKIYGANENYFKEYEYRNPYPSLFVNGDFGENLKAREWLEEIPRNNISLDRIIKEYHIPLPVNKHTFSDKRYYEEYVLYLKDQIRKLVNIYDINVDNGEVNKDNFDELRQIFARAMDNKLVNFRNEFSYSISPYGTTQLYEFMFSVPYEYRRNSRFQLALIKKLDSSVLEIPLFSHTKEFKEKKTNIKHYIKGIIRSKLNDFYHIYYTVKHKNKNTSKIESDFKGYLLKDSISSRFLNISNLYTERLVVRVALYNLLLEDIEVKEIESANKDSHLN